MLLVLFTLEDFIRVRKLSRRGNHHHRGLHVEDTTRAPLGIPRAEKWLSAQIVRRCCNPDTGLMATVPRNPLHCHHFVSLLANDPASPLCTEIDEAIGAGAGERPLDLRLNGTTRDGLSEQVDCRMVTGGAAASWPKATGYLGFSRGDARPPASGNVCGRAGR